MDEIDPALLDRLEGIVGADHLRRANALATQDPGVDPRNLDAGIAIRPGSTEEVSAILAACQAAGAPIVTHGGRTGLAGAAISHPGEIILTTERLSPPIHIDAGERIAVVGAGVSLHALQEAAAAHGLSPGIDIAARGSATIGGLIATNAGGMEAFRYGMMRQRLLGLTAVLPDGSILRDDTRVTKANEGYDLKQLFCGAEGTLGVVTEAVIRLVRADPPSETVMIGCASAAAAIRVMRAYEDQGTLLLAEIMWRLYVERATRAMGLTHVTGFAPDAPIYVIFEVSGGSDAAAEVLMPFIENDTVMGAVLAKNQRESGEIWKIREDTQAVRHEYEHGAWYDVSVPLSGLDTYIEGLGARLDALGGGLTLSAIGHLADGNLHVTVASDAPYPEPERVNEAVEAGLKAAGGAISAEHGIGIAKLTALQRNSAPGSLAAMRAVKAALDPAGIMNPGKVIPT